FVVVGTKVRAPQGVDAVVLAGHKHKVALLPAPKAIHWSTVEPHGFREHTAKNGATSDFYSNVSTETPTFGHWLGYDHIDYFEHSLADTTSILHATITPSEADAVQIPGLG